MFFKIKLLPNSCSFLWSALLLVAASVPVHAQKNPSDSIIPTPPVKYSGPDTTAPKYTGPLQFPIQDRRGDFLSSGQRGTYDFNTPSNITDSIGYDPKTQLYTVYEKIGNRYYRTPTTYSAEEYWQIRGRQAEIDYFRKRANTMNLLNRKLTQPKLSLYDNLFNRLFGNGKIEISPQGNVDITAGYQGQNIKNPTLPERARNNGGFDFNMNAQVNVNANIGDKLKFPISYNTLANFGQDNQLKLDYTGVDDEIIKRIEAGAVQFPSRSTFIPGSQQLFGLKTQLQFGKLNITAVLANQKSQRQSVNLQGGAAAQPIEFKADEYEENRHFLLGQYFKDNYNKVLAKIPAVTTPVQILRLEVWVTNKNGSTTNTRDIVGFMDLGESAPFRRDIIHPLSTYSNVPDNNVNDLFANLKSNPANRKPALVVSNLQNMFLRPVQDFEKTFARKLDSTQYFFNRQAGYISLSQPLLPDEVLGVAYQYSYNGKVYQVGEFSQDLPPDSAVATQEVLFLKLLKATSQRTNLPIWQWMMKNVYSVGYGTLTPTDFKLNLLYQEPGQGWKRYVPFGNINQGTPVLSLVNLDRLNSQLDPQPDGVFDYVEGYTVLSQYSRIVFPVLEPFGRDLAAAIYADTLNTPAIKDTLYYALYDSIKAVAQQYPNLNRFVVKGSAHTSGSSDISIGYNIPKGSVTVIAGGQTLIEGNDYDINYDLGTIKITNQAILNAGLPVQVNFENNAAFGIQQRNYLGLRMDYLVTNKLKEQLSVGGTLVQLSERPFFTKNNLGEEPIKNAMYGLDVNYRKELPRLTKLLDKLPFYSTTAPSSINFYAEGALLKPGHAPQIGSGSAGTVYIDDFEGSKSGIDLRFPAISWALASTPKRATNGTDTVDLFPEASVNSPSLNYGKNRAKLAWYQIEPALQQARGANNPLGENRSELSDPRSRLVKQSEIFPQRTTDFGQNQLTTFDLSFYPTEKGPYNFDDSPASVDANNNLRNPRQRWGGLMRNIDQTDFETANIEFIEFWMQDPFVPFGNRDQTNSRGGKLYFNLGNVSEDILKDGKRFYENGLPTPTQNLLVDTSIWGKVPLNPIQVTNAFSNEPADRVYQDVGFDGNNNDSERIKLGPYLSNLSFLNPPAAAAVQNDPAQDDYIWYRDPAFTANDGIVKRYKNFNNPQGNSQINDGSAFSSAATLYPDGEDLNRDNTMNETEEYFQYTVDIKPPASPLMNIGTNFIVDKKQVLISGLPDGTSRNEIWYQFRIPIGAFNNRVGNIPDFKSIRFIRMFLTDFDSAVVLRFGKLELTRNIWRKYPFVIDTSGTYVPPTTEVEFNVNGVNIEENDKRDPLPYRTPRDIQRQQIQSNNGVNLLQNEQSMSLRFCNLIAGDARGVQQTFANRDLRQFGKLSMYIHAENFVKNPNSVKDRDLNAVIRIGTDFGNNYYEVKIPLYMTPLGANQIDANSDAYNDTLWRAINNLDLDLTTLPKLKAQRNSMGASLTIPYRQIQANGQTYSIMGDPNLGEIRGILLGVENVKNPTACGEMWVNELRLTSINEKGGYAAMARADITLADLGTFTGSISTHTTGFGTLEQRVNERYRDNLVQFDVATTLELGKLLPKKSGISIPFFASYSQTVSKPEYDPFDMDIKLKDKMSAAKSSAQRDSINNAAIDFNSTKTINFTNVRKNRTGTAKPKIYDIENIDLSYSYYNTQAHNPLIETNEVTRHRGAIGYNFAPQPKFIEPFKNIKFFKKRKTHWFDLVKDVNFNIAPSQLSFRADIQRQFGAVRPRSIGSDKYKIPETYDKYYVFQRDYILRWNFTRSINFDFTATNNSRIDEPYGRIDTKEKRDTVWRNLIKGGRNTLYNQTANFSYTLPTIKFPLLDWTAVNLKYQATYRWIGASRLAPELGNILENGQTKEATLQLDFTKLYNKLKFFRAIDQPRADGGNKAEPQTRTDTIFRTVTKDGVKVKEVKKLKIRKIKDPNALPDVGLIGRIFGKLITSVKQVNLSVSETGNTRLPGYTDSTRFIGQDWNSMQPGLDFVFGAQPDTSWLNRAARKGVITKDSFFNSIFQQAFNQRLALTAQIEPVRDLTIALNINKTFSKNYSELFKDTTGTGNNFGHLSPYTGGGFDVSYIAFNTMFEKFDPNAISATFLKLQENSRIISQRLGTTNKYNIDNGRTTPDAEGYYFGYGKYSTDVLIPAFISAYTGKDPGSISLIDQSNRNVKSNPFKNIFPMPNWKIDYTGLSRIKPLDKIFTNVTISHGYTGSLSMNGFTSALLYQDVSRYGYPSFYDTSSQDKNYIPYFLVPNITIQEQFAPLFGIDVMFTNQLQAKVEYVKQRMLSLSLIDFQLSETRSTEFSIGAGYRKKGLKTFFPLPAFLAGKNGGKKLENEINFRFDFKVRDNVTVNYRIGQNAALPTGGSKEITLTPSIDYFLSSRVNVKLFFDQRRVTPYISSSAPIVNTRAGVQVRISLAQ